jgi:peptide/nickel transport system substrate-binding protein
MCPEVVEAGIDDWRNQACSGPFIITDFVKGSGATYMKNPNDYHTAYYDGTVYSDIPFVDKLVMPLIPDPSTQLAALRTAKVDAAEMINWKYKDTLDQTAPELMSHEYVNAVSQYMSFNCTPSGGKWQDQDMRQAIRVGTHIEDIGEKVYGRYIKHFFVGGPQSGFYTAIEDMPDDMKWFYDYDPELSMELLAEAGYPDGFSAEIAIDPKETDPADMAAIIAEQWSKIGIDCELVGYEAAAHDQLRYTKLYPDCYFQGDGAGAPTELLERMSDCKDHAAGWVDPHYDELCIEGMQIVDLEEQEAFMREVCLYYIKPCSRIEMPTAYVQAYWWPWVKNWYGDTEVGFLSCQAELMRMWLDDDLKAEMGY